MISGNYNLIRQSEHQALRIKQNKEISDSPSLSSSDKVLDLTNMEDVSKQDAGQVKYIKVNESGKDVFYSVEAIPEKDRASFIKGIQDKIVNSSKEPDFDLNSFIDISSPGKIQIGKNVEKIKVSISSDVKTDREVLDKSNSLTKNPDSKTAQVNSLFQWANGDHTELTADEVPQEQRVGKDNKPPEWYNAISISPEGNVKVYTHPDSKVSGPTNFTKTDLQDLIKANMNLFGNISELDKAAQKIGKTGEEVFLQALQNNPEISKAFEGNPDLLKEVASEIYSYAKNGHGTDGKIDIAKLQGSLKILHPFINSTASSNTKFDQSSSIPKGDGDLGRATMMEMRHLMAGLDINKISKTAMNIEISQPKEDFGFKIPQDTDVVVFKDTSGSLTEYLGEIRSKTTDIKESVESKGHNFYSVEQSFNKGNSESALTAAYRFLTSDDVSKNVDMKDSEGKEISSKDFSSLDIAGRSKDSKPMRLVFISDRQDNLSSLNNDQLNTLIKMMKEKNIEIVISNPRTNIEFNFGDAMKQIVKSPEKDIWTVDDDKKAAFLVDNASSNFITNSLDYNKMQEPQIKQFIQDKMSQGVPLNEIKEMTAGMWLGIEQHNFDGQTEINDKFWVGFVSELAEKELASGKSFKEVKAMAETALFGQEKAINPAQNKLADYEEALISSIVKFNKSQKSPLNPNDLKAKIQEAWLGDNRPKTTFTSAVSSIILKG